MLITSTKVSCSANALAHYVEALGGRLKVRAVFDDETVIVRSEPADRQS